MNNEWANTTRPVIFWLIMAWWRWMLSHFLVIIASGDGMLPDGTKSVPESRDDLTSVRGVSEELGSL